MLKVIICITGHYKKRVPVRLLILVVDSFDFLGVQIVLLRHSR
ncbi:hypothetical protein PAUR_a2100 [Pseudoalteromonas aurantia 208]|uniref:Uncharacterized protein n=1 Tax=Pseudoalteromonas aurantia 208 TaxID=1314867 RepID=A0ABR9EBX7_9GAMM|nr:hypothetical protein [Pseudoalteromonas aurantia 208]